MKLQPGVSTHFTVISSGRFSSADITIGKVYEIVKWWKENFCFFDDIGEERCWSEKFSYVEDWSFDKMLKKILE